MKPTCWTTGSWRSCLSLEVVSSIPAVIQCFASPGGHCWNTYRRWVGPLRLICGSGTRRFHLRMFGPQMGSGVSPVVRMPQWWFRQWPLEDAPRHQKVALCILSLHVHALRLRVALMPAVRYDLNGGLPTCPRFIIYQEYLVINPRTTKLLGVGWGVGWGWGGMVWGGGWWGYWFHSARSSVCPSVCLKLLVNSQ